MAEMNILSDNELATLRHQDGSMERTGIARSGTRMLWEGAKGATAGGIAGSVAGSVLLGASLLVPPLLPIGVVAMTTLPALGVIAGGAGNMIWGSAAKGAAVQQDNQALQQAAAIGAKQGNITPEQANQIAPKRSLLKGAVTSIGMGATLGAIGTGVAALAGGFGGLSLGGAVGIGAASAVGMGGAATGVAVAAGAIGATLLAAAAPIAIGAAVAAVAVTAVNAVRNNQNNKAMETTMQKAADIGGMKARAAQATVARQQSQQLGVSQPPGKDVSLGELMAPKTPQAPAKTQDKANPLQNKPKKSIG